MTTTEGRQAARERALPAEAVAALADDLGGGVIRPRDPGYDVARRVWNGSVDRRPALIVRCAAVADVLRGVAFAREHGLLLAMRGGGHDVAGRGTCDDGLVLDLSGMKGIRVDPARGVAHVQAGVVWGELDREAAAFGLAVTGGQIASTGVAGLTLGGGLGWLMRERGLTIDHLLSVDVVPADGRLLVASPEEHADLFWAVRGGGGNFGVATSFAFRLRPLGTILGGSIMYPIEQAREVLDFYRAYAASAPETLTVMAYFLTLPPLESVAPHLRGRQVASIAVCYSGDLAEGERLLAPLRALGQPLLDGIRPMPYTLLQRLFDAGSPPGFQNAWKSHYLKPLSREAAATLAEHATRVTSPLSIVLVTAMGGALARVPADATAFSHRDAPFVLEILAKWSDPADAEPHVRWASGFWEAMRPYATGGVYVNFLDAEGPERVRDAYAHATWARLQAVKRQYDAENFFRHNHNVPPDGGED